MLGSNNVMVTRAMQRYGTDFREPWVAENLVSERQNLEQ